MRWMVAVGSGVLLLGLLSCGGPRGTDAHASGSGKSTPSTPEGQPPHGAGGKAGSGGVAGNGYDGGSACPSAPVTTCPGTMSGRWCVETLPQQGLFDDLQGVWSDRADNAWVVGWRSLADGGREAILMHWDGCAWTSVPNPDPVQFQYGRGVWGAAANDLWIVGVGTRALHFDGNALSLVPVPVPDGEGVVEFGAVSGTASNDVWASGRLVSHWDGTAWTAVPVPTGDPNQYFADVWAVAANDVWTAGTRVAAHFDGASWAVTELITGPMGPTSFLYTIWSSGPEAWAAGPGGRIHHFQNGQWTLAVAPDDAGPTLFNLGGLNGDVHLVGGPDQLRILDNGTFVPVADAPAAAGAFYEGVWVSPSQVWVVGSTLNGAGMVLRRAR